MKTERGRSFRLNGKNEVFSNAGRHMNMMQRWLKRIHIIIYLFVNQCVRNDSSEWHFHFDKRIVTEQRSILSPMMRSQHKICMRINRENKPLIRISHIILVFNSSPFVRRSNSHEKLRKTYFPLSMRNDSRTKDTKINHVRNKWMRSVTLQTAHSGWLTWIPLNVVVHSQFALVVRSSETKGAHHVYYRKPDRMLGAPNKHVLHKSVVRM